MFKPLDNFSDRSLALALANCFLAAPLTSRFADESAFIAFLSDFSLDFALAISLPGTMGKFAILDNHAPLVSVLGKGNIYLTKKNEENISFSIDSGFVEVNNNIVKVCVEINKK